MGDNEADPLAEYREGLSTTIARVCKRDIPLIVHAVSLPDLQGPLRFPKASVNGVVFALVPPTGLWLRSWAHVLSDVIASVMGGLDKLDAETKLELMAAQRYMPMLPRLLEGGYDQIVAEEHGADQIECYEPLETATPLVSHYATLQAWTLVIEPRDLKRIYWPSSSELSKLDRLETRLEEEVAPWAAVLFGKIL